MKRSRTTFAALQLAVLVGTCALMLPYAQAQSRPTVDAILQDWAYLRDTVIQLINLMPPEKYSFTLPLQQQVVPRAIEIAGKPFGERAVDIALINVQFLKAIGGKTKAPEIDAAAAMRSKESVVKAVADAFDYGTAVFKEQTEETIWQKVDAPVLGRTSRYRIFRYLQSHTREVDGQLVIYIRLSGEVLPSIN